MRRLAPLSLLALAAVAVGQGFRQRPDNVVVRPDDVANTYHWGPYDSTTGALFDAGVYANSLAASPYALASVEAGNALTAAECEARMLRSGVNNALSNVFSFGDDSAGRRMNALVVVAATLDAGVVVSQSANPLLGFFWRPLSGGDAGIPWANTIIASQTNYSRQQTALGPQTGLFMSTLNTSAEATSTGLNGQWVPGYYCVLPVTATGYGVSHVWLRLNRVFEPK